jgi:hypothetical protein
MHMTIYVHPSKPADPANCCAARTLRSAEDKFPTSKQIGEKKETSLPRKHERSTPVLV